LRKIREDLDKELKADAEKDKKEEVCMTMKNNYFTWRLLLILFVFISQVGTSSTRSQGCEEAS